LVSKVKAEEPPELQMLIRKSGLIPRCSAAAQRNQSMRVFGIKPDVLNKFPLEEPPLPYNATLRIPQGSALRRLI
jgi:hypothetical protein